MELFSRLLLIFAVVTCHPSGDREPEHTSHEESEKKDGLVKGDRREVHRIPLITVPSTATVLISACDSSPCTGGKVCSDLDDGYKCTCPLGKQCDSIGGNILLDGKPAKPQTPTDADIILNSFKPSAPVSPAILNNEQPSAVELEAADNAANAMTNDTGEYGPMYANNEYGDKGLTPAEINNAGNDIVPVNVYSISNGGSDLEPNSIPIINGENETIETEEQNNDDYEDYSPTVGESDSINEIETPTTALGKPENINEIPLPTPPTDDDMDHTAPTIKHKPAVVLISVVKVPRPHTTPETTLPQPTVKMMTSSNMLRPGIITIVGKPCTPNPCRNNGTCLGPDVGAPYSCKCPIGYSGRHCTVVVITRKVQRIKALTVLPTPPTQEGTKNPALPVPPPTPQQQVISPSVTNVCSSNPCQQGGTCIIDVFRNPQDGTYRCLCRPGFTGKSCACVAGQEARTCKDTESRAPPPQVKNVCSSNPCQQGGTCIIDVFRNPQDGTYRCLCRPGFTGRSCACAAGKVATCKGPENRDGLLNNTEEEEEEVDHMLPTPPADISPTPLADVSPTPPADVSFPTPEAADVLTDDNDVDHMLPNEQKQPPTPPPTARPDKLLKITTTPNPDDEVDHMLPTPTTAHPGVSFPTPAVPEAPEGTDIDKLPTITASECKNGKKVDDDTNGCEPIFVYMIKKNKTNGIQHQPLGENGIQLGENGTIVDTASSLDLSACTPNPCQNGGTCHSFNNGEHEYYSCICLIGFEGQHCEVKISNAPNVTMFQVKQPPPPPPPPEPLGNEAFAPTTAMVSTPRKPPLLVMMSKTVTNATKPEEVKDQNVVLESFESDSPCTPNPCQNGGTCHSFDNGKHHYYSCTCLAGFEGDHCQGKVNITFYAMRPSLVQPTPQPPPATSPVNVAGGKQPPLTWPTARPNGPNAPNVPGASNEANPCLTEDEEDDEGREECKPSYVVMMTPRPTLKVGKQMYSDEEDEKEPNPCIPNPCQNGGTCHAFYNGDYHYYSCICPVGFEGTHCQEDVCAECHFFAICPKGKCKCKFGYIGDGYDCVNATTGVGEARDFTEFTLPQLTTGAPTTTADRGARLIGALKEASKKKKKNCLVDVAFILDVSPSMWTNFKYIKKVVKGLSQRYAMCKNGSHAALVTFAGKAKVLVKLKDRLNQSEFNQALDDKIKPLNGTSRLDLALTAVRDTVFTSENGGRKNVKKLVVAVTNSDKPRRNGADNVVVAKIMRHEGVAIHLIVIGKPKLKKIQEISGKQNLYVASNISHLTSKGFLDSIRIEKCAKDEPGLPQPKCSSNVDIGFILDSSGSVWKHYDQEKEFLKSLAMAFGMNENGTHAGVVTFSSGAEHSIKLKDHTDLIEFCEAVDGIRHMGGSTRIDLALKEVKKNMFTKGNGGRKGVRKLVILVTDGVQTGKASKDPSELIDELQDDGVTVVVVGIGNVDQSKLTVLAGKENFYHASNFSELTSDEFVRNVTADTCEKVNLPQSAPQCDLVLDVGFILDSSGSIRKKYGEEKKFIKTLASLLGVSKNGSHAGVVTFSSRAKHSIKLNEYTDLTDFTYALDNIPLIGGGTRIDRALRETKQKMFTPKNGGRADAQRLVVMVTDGEQRGGKDPALAADDLRDEGIALFVIGVGKVNSKHLEKIAGKGNWYLASNFSELNSDSFVWNFTKDTCNKVSAASKPATTKCNKALDIGFVLDSSASIRLKYDKEKSFLKSFAKTLGVGNKKNGSRAGVVTFSSHARHSIKLNDSRGFSGFSRAVDAIPHMNGRTKIDRALKLVRKKMFLKKNGGRKGAEKLVVLLTDGEQTGRGDPELAAKKLRDGGVHLLVIGIGDLNPRKLRKIAGKGNYMLASSFAILNSKGFVDNITRVACKHVGGDAPTQQPTIIKQPTPNKQPTPTNVTHGGGGSGGNKPQLTIYNINLGPTYVFNGLELHQSPGTGTLYGTCPQYGGRVVYEVEQITPDELISLVEPLTSTPESTGGASTTLKLCANRKPETQETDECDVPPVAAVPTYVSSAPVYQAGEEDLMDNITTSQLKVPLTNNVTPSLLLRRAQPIDEQFGAQEPPSFPNNIGLAAPATQEYIYNTQQGEPVAPMVTSAVTVARPMIAGHKRSTRNGRAVPKEQDADFFNFDEWKALNTLTEDIGCSMFLNDLVKYGVIQSSAQFRKAGEHVSIFCPVDSVYKKMKAHNHGKEKSILMNHVAARQDKCGSVYKSLYPGGKIIVSPSAQKRDKVTWKANGVDILISLVDEEGNEIVIVNDVIMPVTKDILDVLESRKDTSMFYEMWRKANTEEIFKVPQIRKVCFINDVCLKLTPSLQKTLHEAVKMKEFTIIAPTNSIVESMGKPILNSVSRTRKSITKFLQDFVFLGSLESPNILHKETAYSLSPQHDMLTLAFKGNMVTLTDDNNQEFKVKHTVRVAEGILHVVEKIS